ncbi:MAG: dihydrofolate reductase [Pseudomonadales bacterium]
MTRNRVIGRDNDLPWHLPKDMKFFMTTTQGHPVIMGRRTFESMGRPLPRRSNIVVSRNPDYRVEGARVVADLPAALAEAERQCRRDGVDEAFVIGGAELYRQAIDHADRLYVTRIDAEIEGDTRFPEIDWSPWRCVRSEAFPADDKHAHPFVIEVFERA